MFEDHFERLVRSENPLNGKIYQLSKDYSTGTAQPYVVHTVFVETLEEGGTKTHYETGYYFAEEGEARKHLATRLNERH